MSTCADTPILWLNPPQTGPISSVTALGTTIVVLHSTEAAVELLDRRSATYSSRPRLPFLNEL